MTHLRAIAALFVLTLLVCCVLYPLALWAIGQTVFTTRANGSLIVEGDQVRGSRLIAQPFTQAKYFKPRPSAVGYNGAGSGGSNLAASNPILRDRVARELGKIARFKSGDRVGPEVQTWFAANPGLLGKWARDNPTLAKRWVKDGDNEKAARAWLATQRDLLPDKEKDDPDKANLDDLAVPILERFANLHPAAWPAAKKEDLGEGKAKFSLEATPVKAGGDDVEDLQSVLFDAWLTAHPDRGDDIEPVPADLVLASGSGLDPHITMRAAKYQLADVVKARAAESKRGTDEVQRDIESILQRHSFRPLLLLGEPLVNVLEVNRALDEAFGEKDGRRG